jgi:hypothetical protein
VLPSPFEQVAVIIAAGTESTVAATTSVSGVHVPRNDEIKGNMHTVEAPNYATE